MAWDLSAAGRRSSSCDDKRPAGRRQGPCAVLAVGGSQGTQTRHFASAPGLLKQWGGDRPTRVLVQEPAVNKSTVLALFSALLMASCAAAADKNPVVVIDT